MMGEKHKAISWESEQIHLAGAEPLFKEVKEVYIRVHSLSCPFRGV